MKDYMVTINVTYQQHFMVEAENKTEAEEKALAMVHDNNDLDVEEVKEL